MAVKGSERGRYTTKFIILIAVFIIAILISIVIGRYSLSIGDSMKVIWSKLPWVRMDRTWDASAEKVLLEIRLPRVAAAVLIGAALSLAGVSYQGMFRNPLVSPERMSPIPIC